MSKYSVVEELPIKPRGGFGGLGGAPDDSDDLSDMKYAEVLVLDEEFLKALSTLKVAHQEGDKLVGGFILLSKEDIPAGKDGTTYDGEMNGAAHKVNQEFVALQIPYYATSYATDDAEKTTRVGKRGAKVGIEYPVTLPDKLRIYRISNTFEIDRYAADGSKKVTEERKNDYHEPTTGMRLRAAKWIDENGADLVDTLKAIGMDIKVTGEATAQE